MVAGTGADAVRLAVASRMGADIVLDVEREDPLQKVNEITGGGWGGGLDFVFEASGNPKSIPQGLAMVRGGGKVILIGIHPTTAEFSPTDLVRGRKSLIGAYAYETETWRRSLALLASGRVQVEPMITHKLPLAQAEEGFELAVRREAAKVIFVP
jgi:threonine dehydrogenase-like Zn-dependent dehydrogenase